METMENLQVTGFYQHPVGLIHGDINVDNLLTKNSEPQAILDFDDPFGCDGRADRPFAPGLAGYRALRASS